jgi:hypothetical protein
MTLVQPCCADFGDSPMESPVTVTYIDAPESWEGVAAVVNSMRYSLEGQGFAMTSVVGGIAEGGGLQLTAELETLDPCPAKKREVRQLTDRLAHSREGVVEMLLPERPQWVNDDKFMQGAYAEWGRIANVLSGRIKRDGPKFTAKIEKVTVTPLDEAGAPIPQHLTFEEHALIQALGDCASAYSTKVVGDNDRTREHDINEFVGHIHDLQARVMMQAAARLYPDKYRLAGGTLAETKNS